MSDFTPILYMKTSCPHCMKLGAFLVEAGIWDRFEIRGFFEGDENEAAIRAELTAQFEKASFPTLQHAPGEYMKESEDIIALFADELGLDPANMSYYQYMIGGPFRRMRSSFRLMMEMRKEMEAAQAKG